MMGASGRHNSTHLKTEMDVVQLDADCDRDFIGLVSHSVSCDLSGLSVWRRSLKGTNESLSVAVYLSVTV